MAEFVAPLVACTQLVFGPIYRNTKSFFKLRSNLNSLQQKQRVLREMEDGVKQELEAADRDGKSATPLVKEWLRQVREIRAVAEKMEPGMMADNGGLVSGCFLSCGVCRKARKTLEEVERLIHACPAVRAVATDHRPPTVEHIPGPSIEDNTTASQNLKRVTDLLIRDEVRSVGIWGMGGVGKTTLVKNLNNKLNRDGQQFGMVIWATVSKDFNRKAVQTQIANRLTIQVGESDEDRMVVRLHERLMKENKFILILDDVWEAIDLSRLGIPDPKAHEGVKILLTSRSARVCHEMNMDGQVEIQVMNDKESWDLFSQTVGEMVNLEEIKPIAQQVCQQCCGLPLATVIVGAAMRGKNTTPLWNDALTELRRSVPFSGNIEEKVFKPLKWSYDRLQGNNVKSCFLYCCLYPEDYSIRRSELFKCWVGEGLIDEELNFEHSFNRGLALIENLKEACLLETGERTDTVKMHDVVRDVAIWIASNYTEDGSRFLVKAGIGLTRLSEVKFTADLRRISFMNNEINRLSCDDACLIECFNASTLFLQGNYSIAEIPDRFLRRFQAIRVLNLSYTHILSLPPSLMQLRDIRTLLFRGCERLAKLPTFGWEGLKMMQVLDLSSTAISALPKGMELLMKLRELNLSYTKSLRSIPAKVFPVLSSLEILNMEGSSYIWGLEREAEDGKAYLEELERLYTLSELLIEVKPKSSLIWVINPTWIARLRSFQFCIGSTTKKVTRWIPRCLSWKEIIMRGINPAEEVITEYLVSTTNATSLLFHDCRGLDKLVQEMGLRTGVCFSTLKSLNIEYASMNFKDTLGGGYSAKYDLLPNLEYLRLHEVRGMRSISELAGHLGLAFSKLRRLIVSYCNEMKHLLSVGHHVTLESLVEIDTNKCRELEEVFQYVPYAHGHIVEVVPKLKSIYLCNLPELRTLCKSNKAETWPSLETIEVSDCDKLRSLPISGLDNTINEIKGEESWWNDLEWDDPNTKTSLQHLLNREQERRLTREIQEYLHVTEGTQGGRECTIFGQAFFNNLF